MEAWTVTQEEAGMRIAAFVQLKSSPKISGRQAKQAIEANRCRVNGKVENFGSFRLKAKDRVEFIPDKPALIKEKILFEDSDLLCLDKPAGITSETLAKKYRARLVHRLDRNTTGVFLLAKTAVAEENLTQQFRVRAVEKTYLALVDGVVKKESGVCDQPIGKISSSGKIQWGIQSDGAEAITDWRRLEQGKNAALLECSPVTGRTHQIRVHLSDMGHPVLGDTQYCRKFHCTATVMRPLLHAANISFEHPVSGKKMQFHSPLPKDFQSAVDQLL